ncbi:MAG: hypothetical protein FJ241_10405 [Nitrospira sp.]|nr:hypothetical protein [Nitrospira sp.]
MKKKVGTILDEELFFRVKKAAVIQRKSLSQLLEDALETYLTITEKETKETQKNISRSTQGVMSISKDLLKAIMEEEGVYES